MWSEHREEVRPWSPCAHARKKKGPGKRENGEGKGVYGKTWGTMKSDPSEVD